MGWLGVFGDVLKRVERDEASVLGDGEAAFASEGASGVYVCHHVRA